MGLSEQSQQKVWLLAQKSMDCSDLDKLLSNMHILSNVYKKEIEDDCDSKKLFDSIVKMIDTIKNFRTHKIVRKQDVINDLKIEIDDLLSEMITTIDPKVMLEFNIYESANV